ncbi:unnamed protein product [Protopolystoma xenopodis]|uniref:Uncharacterized protein n=1 Tax=Protopolystoma xenopodis TaxID=117903 RepID=A0A448XG60_9PLAT|nr:unnamed protein product [Protopolystoma xenopodis]
MDELFLEVVWVMFVLAILKTYPRHPQSSLRQQLKPSRAEKDRLRRERKEAEKTAKLADLARLRQLKMQEYADKLARIRRSCEVDSSSVRQSTSSKQVNLKDISIRKPDVEVGPEGKATKMAHQEVIFSLLEEEDWDPVKQDKLMSLLFENKDDELTGTQDNEEELKDKGSQDDSDEDKPVFSEDSDLDNWRPSGFVSISATLLPFGFTLEATLFTLLTPFSPILSKHLSSILPQICSSPQKYIHTSLRLNLGIIFLRRVSLFQVPFEFLCSNEAKLFNLCAV